MDPPLIAHTFGTGFGETHTWHAPAEVDLNRDGRLDSIRLDFDGDGIIDDFMIDVDGDGVADVAALDLDDDGVPDAFFADAGNGVWGIRIDPPAGVRGGDPPRPGRQPQPVDLDGDGQPDAMLITRGQTRELRIDTNGDGEWDVALIDSDGDGAIDRVQYRDR